MVKFEYFIGIEWLFPSSKWIFPGVESDPPSLSGVSGWCQIITARLEDAPFQGSNVIVICMLQDTAGVTESRKPSQNTKDAGYLSWAMSSLKTTVCTTPISSRLCLEQVF